MKNGEPLVSFGETTVPFQDVLVLVQRSNLGKVSGFWDDLFVLKDIARLASIDRIEIRGALSAFSHCEAGDPRDKVYSILPLVQNPLFQAIVPDYSKSFKEVYAEATAAIIVSERSLAILDYIFDPHETEALRKRGALSSWSIDFSSKFFKFPGDHDLKSSVAWNTKHSTKALEEHDSLQCIWTDKGAINGHEVSPRPLTQTPTKLRLQGLLFDQIILATEDSEVSSLRTPAADRKQDRLYYANIWGQVCAKLNYYTPYVAVSFENGWEYGGAAGPAQAEVGDPWARFGRAMADLYLGTDTALYLGTETPSLQQWRRAARIWGPLADVSLESMEHYSYIDTWKQYFPRMTNNIAIILTENRFLGIGREHCEPGDQIVMVYGSAAPLVLRPCGDEYTFEGFAYVYGIMEGELKDKIAKYCETREFIVC